MILENFQTYEGFITRAELADLIKISGLHTMINNGWNTAETVFVGKINQKTFPEINVKISKTLEKAKVVQAKSDSIVELLTEKEYLAVYEDLYYHLDLETEQETLVELPIYDEVVTEGANWWTSIFKSFKSKLQDVAKTKLSKKVEVKKTDANKYVVSFMGKDLIGVEFTDKISAYVPDGTGFIGGKDSPKKYSFNRNLDEDSLIDVIIKAYKANNKDAKVLEAATPNGLSLSKKATDILVKLLSDDKITDNQLINIISATDQIENSLGERQAIDVLFDDEENYVLSFPIESKAVAASVARDLQLLSSFWSTKEAGGKLFMDIKIEGFELKEAKFADYCTSKIRLFSNLDESDLNESDHGRKADIKLSASYLRFVNNLEKNSKLPDHIAKSKEQEIERLRKLKVTKKELQDYEYRDLVDLVESEDHDPYDIKATKKDWEKAKRLDKELSPKIYKEWKGFEKGRKDGWNPFYVVGFTRDPEVYESVLLQIVFEEGKGDYYLGWAIWTELDGGYFITEPAFIEDEKQLKQLLKYGLDFGLEKFKDVNEALTIDTATMQKIVSHLEETNPDVAKEITQLVDDKEEVPYKKVSDILDNHKLELKKIFKEIEKANENVNESSKFSEVSTFLNSLKGRLNIDDVIKDLESNFKGIEVDLRKSNRELHFFIDDMKGEVGLYNYNPSNNEADFPPNFIDKSRLNESKETDRVKMLNDKIRSGSSDAESKRLATQLNVKFADKYGVAFDPHPEDAMIRVRGLQQDVQTFFDENEKVELAKGWQLSEYEDSDGFNRIFLTKLENDIKNIYNEVKMAFLDAKMNKEWKESGFDQMDKFSKMLRKDSLDKELINKAYQKAGVKHKFEDSPYLKSK